MSEKRMIRSTWAVTLLTLLSRLLALVRDKGLVLIFGPSGVLDAFLLAFTIPNLFRKLFGEGALSSAFIPVFVDYRENYPPEKASSFAGALVGGLMLILAAITGAGVLLALGGAGLAEADSNYDLTLKLIAVMFPFLLFICLSATLAGMLQSLRVFALPAAMPVLLNIGFIAALVFVHWGLEGANRREAIYYVAFVVVATAAMQVLIQFGVLWWRGVSIIPRIDWQDEGIRQVMKAMGPMIAGLAVFQVNVLCDHLIAYLLVADTGALTHLYLGNRMMQLPLGLFSIALATTAFPELVSHMKRKEWQFLFEKIATGLRFLLFLTLPAAVGLVVLSEPVIRMIFQEPDLVFSDESVYRTSLVLSCYALGLVFISMQQFCTRIFYARNDYRTPVRISFFMVGLNLILNVTLIHAPDLYLRYMYGTGGSLNEAGLALSTSICAVIGVIWMWRLLRRDLARGEAKAAWEKAIPAVLPAMGRILAAALGMGVFAFWVARSIQAQPELWMRLERGLVSVFAAGIIYVILCYVVPVPEFEEFLGREKKNDKPPEENKLP